MVATAAGNILWDPAPFVDDAAFEAVRAMGGLGAVASSHPHMYGAAVEWSHAFGAEILLPAADAGWLMRPDPAVRKWTEALEVLPGVTLVQCGGHFPGSSVLHVGPRGPTGRGAILCGDTIFVTPGEDRVSFVYSAPARLPLAEPGVRGIVEALAPCYELPHASAIGGWWTPAVRADGKAIPELRSAQRYVELLSAVARLRSQPRLSSAPVRQTTFVCVLKLGGQAVEPALFSRATTEIRWAVRLPER